MIFHAVLGWSQVEESVQDEDGDHFTGLISRLNAPARLARIRTDFENIKFNKFENCEKYSVLKNIHILKSQMSK